MSKYKFPNSLKQKIKRHAKDMAAVELAFFAEVHPNLDKSMLQNIYNLIVRNYEDGFFYALNEEYLDEQL